MFLDLPFTIRVLQVEDDIEFLVVNKKAKLCEDDSSEDRSSPDIMEQIKDIKLPDLPQAIKDLKM